MLLTACTGTVASRQQAVRRAAETLDGQWLPILEQVANDRCLPWQLVDPPRAGPLESALEWAR